MNSVVMNNVFFFLTKGIDVDIDDKVNKLVDCCLTELYKKEDSHGAVDFLAWMPSAREAQVREAMKAIAPYVTLIE